MENSTWVPHAHLWAQWAEEEGSTRRGTFSFCRRPPGTRCHGGTPGCALWRPLAPVVPWHRCCQTRGKHRGSLLWGLWQRSEQNYHYAHEKLTRRQYPPGLEVAQCGQVGVSVAPVTSSPLLGVTLPAPKPAYPSGISISHPGRTQPLGRCVPVPCHHLWDTSGRGDTPSWPWGLQAG